MKKQLEDLYKGIIIGIANVIPGLSGGTIAIVLNVYDKFINSFKNLLSHPFKTIKDIWGLLLGIAIGIAVSTYIIVELVRSFPIPTTMLFVGFIIGGIPRIYQNVKVEKKTIVDFLIFLGSIIILVGLPFIPGRELDIVVDVKTMIILFIVGIIVASTMIIPGISGSMILMALGYYMFIMGTVTDFLVSVVHFQVTDILTFLIPLIPFGIGVLLGVVFISKIISKLLVKYSKAFYCAVLGLLIASPYAVIYSMVMEYGDNLQKNLVANIVIGIITLIIGSVISLYMASIKTKE